MKLLTPVHPKTGKDYVIFEPLDWVHAVTTQIPDARQHLVRYQGAYANTARSLYRPEVGEYEDRQTGGDRSHVVLHSEGRLARSVDNTNKIAEMSWRGARSTARSRRFSRRPQGRTKRAELPSGPVETSSRTSMRSRRPAT